MEKERVLSRVWGYHKETGEAKILEFWADEKMPADYVDSPKKVGLETPAAEPVKPKVKAPPDDEEELEAVSRSRKVRR